MGHALTAPPTQATTRAVVVAYEPGPGLAARLRAVLDQVAHVVVVDNASRSPVASTLDGLPPGRVTVLRNEANVGLGAALNQGVQAAIAQGAAWVLTLDDDSTVAPHLLAAYADALGRASDPDRVGQLGCNYWDANRGRPGLHPFYWRFAQMPSVGLITSGALLRAAAYQGAGPLREDYFIDWIDFEYNLRLQRAGWVPLLVNEVLMDHALGGAVRHRFPVARLCNHHAPSRTYYKVRNRLATLREYGDLVPASLRHPAFGLLATVRHALLHDRRKLRHLRAILLGVRDARRGRMGPAPAALQGGRHA